MSPGSGFLGFRGVGVRFEGFRCLGVWGGLGGSGVGGSGVGGLGFGGLGCGVGVEFRVCVRSSSQGGHPSAASDSSPALDLRVLNPKREVRNDPHMSMGALAR